MKKINIVLNDDNTLDYGYENLNLIEAIGLLELVRGFMADEIVNGDEDEPEQCNCIN